MSQDLISNTQNFGQKLKVAREQAGFDLETLARRLHIRSDIIKTIENCDFDRMPAAGYAKNMIRSYARCVGLNQNEIANQYLAELASFERSSFRNNDLEQDTQISRRSNRSSFLDLDSSRKDRMNFANRIDENLDLIDSNHDYNTTNTRTSNRFSSYRKDRATSRTRTKKHLSTSAMSSSYTLGNSPRINIPKVDIQKLSIVIVAVIIIFLLFFIVSLLFNKGSSKSQEELPTMPISGLTDTSKQDSSSTSTQSIADHVTFKVEVEEGSESWCIVTIDGNQTFAGIIGSGEKKTYEIKGTLEFLTANPTPVKIYIDDAEQKLSQQDSSAYYIFSYTYDSKTSNSRAN